LICGRRPQIKKNKSHVRKSPSPPEAALIAQIKFSGVLLNIKSKIDNIIDIFNRYIIFFKNQDAIICPIGLASY
jgi:hypothetical protein